MNPFQDRVHSFTFLYKTTIIEITIEKIRFKRFQLSISTISANLMILDHSVVKLLFLYFFISIYRRILIKIRLNSRPDSKKFVLQILFLENRIGEQQGIPIGSVLFPEKAARPCTWKFVRLSSDG